MERVEVNGSRVGGLVGLQFFESAGVAAYPLLIVGRSKWMEAHCLLTWHGVHVRFSARLPSL